MRFIFLQGGLRLAVTGSAAMLLAGCALPTSDPESRAALAVPRAQREATLRNAWKGRDYDTLVGAYGTPLMTMEIPGRAENLTFAAVYGVRDDATHCIDAFTVIIHRGNSQRVVVDYFCR